LLRLRRRRFSSFSFILSRFQLLGLFGQQLSALLFGVLVLNNSEDDKKRALNNS